MKQVEVIVFQWSLLERGLCEFHDPEDKIPERMREALGYSAVLVDEYLGVIRNLGKEVIHKDLLVSLIAL